jgi:hypothetical protein
MTVLKLTFKSLVIQRDRLTGLDFPRSGMVEEKSLLRIWDAEFSKFLKIFPWILNGPLISSKGQCHKIFTSCFIYQTAPPCHNKHAYKWFNFFFSNICRVVNNLGASPVSTSQVKDALPFVDICEDFLTRVNLSW